MNAGLNRKEVNKFTLDDCSTREIIEFLSGEVPLKKVAVGVHVTTLNSLYKNQLMRRHFDVVDVVYCDGWSMYILGKAAGLRNIQRIATTDLYPLIISQLNRPLKICFLGGDSQLGPLIIANWIEKYPRDSCTFFDGFPSDWQEIFSRIKIDPPDILFLGLGMPLELQILERYENSLPDCLIISCGGMLRILAGVESRSPMLIQNLKLEWFYRLVTSPRRTFSRYFSGTLNVSRAIIQIIVSRTASKH
jgi:exopolysaccharide biosynthesis WecB/TagA/CpsF family protein